MRTLFKCDIEKCERKPYMEMYDLDDHKWKYLCFIHYLKDRWKNHKRHGYCRVETAREELHNIHMDIFELESEILELKQMIEELKK